MQLKIETKRKPSCSGNLSKQKAKPLQSSLSMKQRLELDSRFAERSLWVWRSRREGRSPGTSVDGVIVHCLQVSLG